ncbi:hypothetical protein [Liquorilactobacillus capillatus]|uniref:PepSY domain-containing protein n=1 Tax=Liquorilactobacillus capillatus DSM 19910 TaxID=1423731 RepID=A0A0R1MD56_9LACO|nr:hypothetical protein [Liquorilactobacillus capillatus]KRL03189.1 hypothetical protein FC81_GL000191 [Liquorilactobacillus capillatus DSM 19910]
MKTFQAFSLPLTLGMLFGFTTSIYINKLTRQKKKATPQKILKKVKTAFQKEIPIQGAWINTFTQPFQKFALKTDVYCGGISRFEDHQLIQYRFWADAKTGGVIDLKRL